MANPIPGRHDHGRPWSRRRRLVRRRHPRFRHACRLLRPTCQRLFRSELPLSFPDRPRAVLQWQAAELRPAFRGTGGGRFVPVRRRLCRRGDLALHQPLSHPHPRRGPEQRADRPPADQDHQQGRVSSAVVRHRCRALLARRGRIPPQRAGIRRRGPGWHSRDLQQSRPGGQGRNQVHAAGHAIRLPDQLDRHAVRSPADRHRGRCRQPARLRPDQPGRGLFLTTSSG